MADISPQHVLWDLASYPRNPQNMDEHLPPYDSRAVANFLLDLAAEQNRTISLMPLLKIIYFAHGWHYVKYGEPLVLDAFEAWEYGPVIRVVWEAFRGQKDKPIQDRASKFDPTVQTKTIAAVRLPPDRVAFLKTVFQAYGGLHAYQLSDMTHAPGSPWDQVWNAPEGRVTLGMRISNEAIREHFQSHATRQISN